MKRLVHFYFVQQLSHLNLHTDSRDWKNISTNINYYSNDQRNYDYQYTIDQSDYETQKVNDQNNWQVQQVVTIAI